MDKIDEKIDKFLDIFEENEVGVDAWIEDGLIQLCLDNGIVIGIKVEEDGESKPFGLDGYFTLDCEELEAFKEIFSAIDDFNEWERNESLKNKKQNENQEN